MQSAPRGETRTSNCPDAIPPIPTVLTTVDEPVCRTSSRSASGIERWPSSLFCTLLLFIIANHVLPSLRKNPGNHIRITVVDMMTAKAPAMKREYAGGILVEDMTKNCVTLNVTKKRMP